MLARYIIPVAPYALAAFGLLVCLFLTVTTGTEVRRLKSDLGPRQRREATATRELELKIAELNERLRDTEEHAGMLAPPAPAASGLNINRRSQVLRLARHGERPENIATLLGLPRREVELLLKVHAVATNGAGIS